MLKIKNKAGELIAELSDNDEMPQFIKDKKTKKSKKKKKKEEDDQTKDEEQTL